VRHVRDEVKARLRVHGIEKIPDAWQFIGIDATPVQADLTEASPLPPLDYLQLRAGATKLTQLESILRAAHPPVSRRGYKELFGWRPNPQLFPQDITVGLTNRAVGRVVGTVALQAPGLRQRIDKAVNDCRSGAAQLNTVARDMGLTVGGYDTMSTNVLVITSMAGGCGAGISLDVVDLLMKYGGAGVQPILIAYGTDIFADSQQYMSSNNLGYIAELLNASWSDKPPHSDIFKASAYVPDNRKPRATFVLGRRNLQGMDLQDSRNVYRSVGITIAGWMTTPSVRQRFQDWVIGNWDAAPLRLGGMGFANDWTTGCVSSFGSATLAVGRKRFREYARKYVLRDLYEHHHRGFKKVAISVFGDEGDRGIEQTIKSKLVDRFLPEVTESFGLKNAFDKQMGILNDGSAQISDALLSRSHLEAFAGKIRSELDAVLPSESIRGSEWSTIIREELPAIKRRARVDAEAAYKAREEVWLASLVKKVLHNSNQYLTRLTLPVMIDLSQRINEELGRSSNEFKTSAQVGEEKSTVLLQDANNELADVASNSLTKDSPQVLNAIELFAAAGSQELKAHLSRSVAQTLEQVIINLMQPLNNAFRRAKDDVDQVADSATAGQAPLITKWPERHIVPRSFQPSPIEHLLDSYEDWPATIERLLRTAEPVRPGESTEEAIRRGISDGVEQPGDISKNDIRPLIWTQNNAPIDFARTSPMSLEVGLDLASLEERVDRWLGKPGSRLSDYLREGLKAYLIDTNHPEHAARMRKFREKFQSALEQARPFVQVDPVYFATAYPNTSNNLGYTVEPIPFQSGHPAHTEAENLIRINVGGAGGEIAYTDQDRESVTVSCFFEKPMFPGVISSMFEAISQHAVAFGGRASDLRGWLDFKRGRTLDECIPLPADVTRTLIRGFVVGRLTGLVKLPKNSSEPVEISSPDGTLQFPHPSYSVLSHHLTSLLMSFVLCFLEVSRLRSQAFAAYAQLFRLGVVSADGDIAPNRFVVSGDLAEYLESGKTALTSIGSKNSTGVDRSERIATALEHISSVVEALKALDAKPFDGSETVNRLVTWVDDSVPVREIADLLIEEYERVEQAIKNYREPGIGREIPQ
jgi:hypothetical protein